MMPDREKVIKGLGCCIYSEEECECPEDCPYVDDDMSECQAKVMRDALELLKEQQEQLDELVPPKKWIICKACGHKLRNDWLWCPWCRWEIRQGYNADELN